MKIGKRTLVILVVLILFFITNTTIVNASSVIGGEGSQLHRDGEGVQGDEIDILDGFGAKKSNTGDTVMKSANIVIGIIQAVGIAAAIIMLIMVAIKYLTAAPGEKADIKKSIIIYVVGAVLLFAATGILGIIQGFANEIAPTETANTTNNGGAGGGGAFYQTAR